MRVRVRFRYRADTGQVEIFQVDDADGGPRAVDHDRRHDRAAADIARVVEQNPLVEAIAAGYASRSWSTGDVEPQVERDSREERRVDG
jgi:hypothetical protein